MPWNLRIIHARDWLRTNATGNMDLQTSKRIIRELASWDLPQQCDILIDIRETIAKHDPGDIYEAVSELVRFRQAFLGRKLAVLDADDEYFYRNTKLAELLANNRGIELRGFTNFEEAVNWLIRETPLTSSAWPDVGSETIPPTTLDPRARST